MAAIDKIYGSDKQYDEFYKWCQENNPKLLNYFYPKEGYNSTLDRPITNFPMEMDMWLLKNCPIPWVITRIKYQYDLEE